jgi:hypothetical protein
MPPIEAPKYPPCDVSRAIDLIERTLRAAPSLSGVSWKFYEGDARDCDPITYDVLPVVELESSLGPSQWQDEYSHRFPLNLGFTLYCKGTRPQFLYDFWFALLKVLFPSDNVLLNQLQVFNCFSKTIVGPTPKPQAFESGAVGLKGTGLVQLQVRVST